MENTDIQELTEFLMDYAISMLSVGTYTARVIKCTTRIGKAFGYEVHISIFSRNITISVFAKQDYSLQRTYVRTYKESAINFNNISLLSALSWHAYDEKVTLKQIKKLYEKIIHKKHYGYFSTLALTCFAHSAFCKLFGGDLESMPIVFVSTFIGFNLKKILLMINVDIRFVFALCAFAASMTAYIGTTIIASKTPDVAIGTSVLFLIPGVYLINSVIDILDGHYLIGISRAVSTFIIICCIAIGLYITLSITGIRMEY
ncbi:threonine/serine exporter ThrE family protein [Helicobacter sp. MIT 99-5507]|uniref:threonine/serine ThrE exporter family protein n=1 Tax=Helicobacter sp. MIT 99-5507 TaxID=152489 RepID=UPI000E1EAFB0|nr:threonine/serine exporter family protein [Helicobacter sp. MIT 99-5507]RDU58006.1 hypothetical protein CQA42_03650 [Helicobacter sp. MIT 99-5507]